jgi:ketosteroid isomerase-like protein
VPKQVSLTDEGSDVSDREEIEEAIGAMYWAIDDQDADALRACLTDNCILSGELIIGTPPVLVEGIEAILANFGHANALVEKEQHFFSNLMVKVEGDTARARIYQWGPYVFPGAGENVAKGGFRVEHTLRRSGTRWLIASSKYTPVWAEHGSEMKRVRTTVFGSD